MFYADPETRRLLVRERHIELARDARVAAIARPVIAESGRRLRLRLPQLRVRLRPATHPS